MSSKGSSRIATAWAPGRRSFRATSSAMTAGRGVTHSEFNPSTTDGVHFLQIWIEPAVRGLAPSYAQTSVPEAAKRGKLALIAGPRESGRRSDHSPGCEALCHLPRARRSRRPCARTRPSCLRARRPRHGRRQRDRRSQPATPPSSTANLKLRSIIAAMLRPRPKHCCSTFPDRPAFTNPRSRNADHDLRAIQHAVRLGRARRPHPSRVDLHHVGIRQDQRLRGLAGYIASKGLPMPQALAAATILVELGGGMLLVVGWKARWAALAIAGFTLLRRSLPQLLDVPDRAADEPVQQLLEEHLDRRRHADGSRVRAGTLRRRQATSDGSHSDTLSH